MRHQRRKDRRHVINRVARFQAEVGALPRDCLITDMSKTGAKLFAEGVEVPDRFSLLIAGAQGIRRDCRVVWRLGSEIGVEFTSPPRLDRGQ